MKNFTISFFFALCCCTALNAQINRANTKKSIPYKANYQRMAASGDHTLEISCHDRFIRIDINCLFLS